MKNRRQASGTGRKAGGQSDEQYIAEISSAVLNVLRKRKFFQALDDILAPVSSKAESCHGDFRHSKKVLKRIGLTTSDDWSDVSGVLQAHGGFCDCEVLYNVADQSRLASNYWKSKHEELTKKPLP